MSCPWKQTKIPARTPVRVFQLGDSISRDAVTLNDFDILTDFQKLAPLLFKLSNDKVINAYDCYWIPKTELTPESIQVFDELEQKAHARE